MKVESYEWVVRRGVGITFDWVMQGGSFDTKEEANLWIKKNGNPFRKYRVVNVH